MQYKQYFLILFFFITSTISFAQKQVINILDSGRKTSIRGLSVVDNNTFWASGSNGSVARSTDGGKTITWMIVAGYEKRDFRDIEAFDSNTAIIMAIAEPAVILKTKDAGKSWYKVFEDTTKGMFLDAMDFDERGYGVVIGDPINSFAFIATTRDNGEHWNKYSTEYLLAPGEAFFASSGTNVKIYPTRHNEALFFAFASGGIVSNYYFLKTNLPLIKGKESTGANSLANWGEGKWIVVGGDFTNDKDTIGNCALSDNMGLTWNKPTAPPHGYRSCVEFITEDKLITCGTSGVDISNDSGKNWMLISTQSFHVCQRAKSGNKVFLAGGNGKIAVLEP